MGWSSGPANFGKPIEVLMSENIARVFNINICEFDEYASNFTVGLLDGSEKTWALCFDTMPSGIDRHAYLEYLKNEVESCDFQPYPHAHTFESYSEEQIDMVKRELKPKYMALVAFAKKRLA